MALTSWSVWSNFDRRSWRDGPLITMSVIRWALIAIVVSTGCVRVAAHQRGYLAQPVMNPEAAPLEQKIDAHVTEYREGSIGGTGVGGGGCGCN